MGEAKAGVSERQFFYEDLRAEAFGSVDHRFTLADIRKAAYAQKVGKSYDPDFEKHLKTCAYCSHQLDLIQQVDPLLTGDDERLKVVVHAVQDRAMAVGMERRAAKSLAAAAGKRSGLLATAADVFHSIVGSSKQ